jgi:hypothetical protein
MEGFGSDESSLARDVEWPGKTSWDFGIPATAWAGLSLSARFCVWPIIGTRKVSETLRDDERSAESRGHRWLPAKQSVTTGSGRKHVPTLFETQSEKSATQMIARTRGWKRFSPNRFITISYESVMLSESTFVAKESG